MPEVTINYWAVFVSALASQVIGTAWYSPSFLGRQWMKAVGWNDLSPEKMAELKKGATPAYAVSFLMALLMAYVLSHFVDYVGAKKASEGLQLGFWIWLGFVATAGLTNTMFEARPKKLFIINSAYFLAVLLVMGALLAAWG